MVAGALCNKMRESTRKRKREWNRETESVSACSSTDAKASSLPFFLLDYAMRKDEAHATDNEGKWRV
jgi:hypothetical protein